jgi:biopolymer transport protein ExbD
VKHLFPLLLLILAACGGGDNGPGNAGSKPGTASKLVSFDAAGLDAGITLPVFTEYWTHAEARNGNTYPIRVDVDDEIVMPVRLTADGFAIWSHEYKAASVAAVINSFEQHARRFWIESQNTSPAAIVLFCDKAAAYTDLLKLCKGLAELRLPNLWLVTHDARGDALRLLPLFIDTKQATREWYHLDADENSVTATVGYMQPVGKPPELYLMHHVEWLKDRSAGAGARWTENVPAKLKASGHKLNRVQFDMTDGATCNVFAQAVARFADVGFARVEPFWPALDRPEGGSVKQTRKLARYDDALDVVGDVKVPSMSDYWRASAADDGLAAPATLDADAFGWRVTAEGKFSTRAPGESEWTHHSDELEALRHLQRSADIDFDVGVSDLPVVLAMDREAQWDLFLTVREFLRTAACYRLLVVVDDTIGPTRRLLDLSLSLHEPPPAEQRASVLVERDEAGAYRVTFHLDGEDLVATGPAYATSLTRWAIARKSNPAVLGVAMPRNEPFSTLFDVLNSLARLGMASVVIGG